MSKLNRKSITSAISTALKSVFERNNKPTGRMYTRHGLPIPLYTPPMPRVKPPRAD